MNARNATETVTNHFLVKALHPVFSAVTLALLSWAAVTLLDIKENDAIQTREIQYINRSLNKIDGTRYTRENANTDWAVQRGRDALQDLRIDGIDMDVEALQKSVIGR